MLISVAYQSSKNTVEWMVNNMLGTEKQRTEGIKRQADELIEQAYQRGFKAGQENAMELEVSKYIEKGRDEAWDAFKTIHKFAPYCFLDCFPNGNDELYSLSIHEVIRRVHEYDQKKQEDDSEIHVGDEVYCKYRPHVKFVVTKTDDMGHTGYTLNGFSINGEQFCDKDASRWVKTGRHFPEIAEVLEKMKEGE